jgi:hypothetical protein
VYVGYRFADAQMLSDAEPAALVSKEGGQVPENAS